MQILFASGPYLTPRLVTVPLFEYHNSLFIGYLLFILATVCFYRAWRSKSNQWWWGAALLTFALVLLLFTNLLL